VEPGQTTLVSFIVLRNRQARIKRAGPVILGLSKTEAEKNGSGRASVYERPEKNGSGRASAFGPENRVGSGGARPRPALSVPLGAETLNGIRTMVDFKTVPPPGQVYRSRSCTEGCEVVDKKQGQVKKEYRNRCRVLDAQMGVGGEGVTGPFEKTLDDFGKKGEVLAPVIGAFAEMSGDVHILADFVASAQAELYCARFDEEPKVAKGVFKQRLYREWGHTAHRGWARLSCWIGGRSSLCCRDTMVGQQELGESRL
jgi:hypothetical protein